MGSFGRRFRELKQKQQREASVEKHGLGTVEAYERKYGTNYSNIDSFATELKDERETYGTEKRKSLFGNVGSMFGN